MQDKTQLTMLVTWLVELFLTSLGKLKDRGLDETSEYDAIQDKFRSFMAYPRIKVSNVTLMTIFFALKKTSIEID